MAVGGVGTALTFEPRRNGEDRSHILTACKISQFDV
jgi:hypothetical protein